MRFNDRGLVEFAGTDDPEFSGATKHGPALLHERPAAFDEVLALEARFHQAVAQGKVGNGALYQLGDRATGRTRFTKPMICASAALKWRAVKKISLV